MAGAAKTNGKQGFQPGQSGNPKGRPPGVPTRTTYALKEAILIAASNAGDEIALQKMRRALEHDGEIVQVEGGLVGYLMEVALRWPQSFMPILAKVLPLILQSSGVDPEAAETQRRAERFVEMMQHLIERADTSRPQ